MNSPAMFLVLSGENPIFAFVVFVKLELKIDWLVRLQKCKILLLFWSTERWLWMHTMGKDIGWRVIVVKTW